MTSGLLVGPEGVRDQPIYQEPAHFQLGDGEIVSTGEILMDVWGEPIPASAQAGLYAYVSRLRGLLGTGAIVRNGGGYLLDREEVKVDAQEFTRELSAGQRALAQGDDPARTAAQPGMGYPSIPGIEANARTLGTPPDRSRSRRSCGGLF